MWFSLLKETTMPKTTTQPCDCSRFDVLEEKLENCRKSKEDSCENERNELKSLLEATKKKLVLFQILCAVSLAILGKEGASEAISYFTSVESVVAPLDQPQDISTNDEKTSPSLDAPFRSR